MDTQKKLFLKYLQGDCEEHELQEINKWLAESEQNREEFFAMELAFHSGRRKKFTDSTFLEIKRRELDRKIKLYEAGRKRKAAWVTFSRYAAAIALLLVMGIGGYFYINSNRNTFILLEAGNEVRSITLSDGTRVWLNKNSQLKYPETFTSKNRKVILSGEAYFDVVSDKGNPFMVDTDNLSVIVYGTTFNLDCSSESSCSSVSLIEGEVKVKSRCVPGDIVLTPGQKAKLNKTSGKLYVLKKNTRLDAVWHNKLIPFEHAGMPEILASLEELYQVKFDVSDSIMNYPCTYTGVLKRHTDIEVTLNSLQNSIPFKYKVEGERICLFE